MCEIWKADAAPLWVVKDSFTGSHWLEREKWGNRGGSNGQVDRIHAVG